MAHAYPPIQIVNENGEFLELIASPNEAKKARKIRAISRVTLTDTQGKKYLLQKRAGHMEVWPGRWDHSAAGHVDEGETPEQAAYREMQEEIGITDCQLQFENTLFFEHPVEADGSQNRMLNYFYSGVFDGDIAQLTLDPDEVSQVRWFDESEILAMIESQPDSVTDGLIMLFKKAA